MSAHLQIKPLVARTELPLPLYLAPVSAGFPSPAEDYLDRALDLNELLISNPAATFYVRASGDSMRDAGIQTGDILSADRVIEPRPGKIVIHSQPSQRPRTQLAENHILYHFITK